MKIKVLKGTEAENYLEALGRLRIEVFREWPYLYEGNMDYEWGYLRAFMESKDSILIVAMDGGEVVGASTGLPMETETENVKGPLADAGYPSESVFYFGESVLRKPYRGKGIGVEFFKYREEHARQLGRFSWLAFCGVVRPDDHPLRPLDYIPLDRFWRKRGFESTDIFAHFSWKDLNETLETVKPLRFWVKELVM